MNERPPRVAGPPAPPRPGALAGRARRARLLGRHQLRRLRHRQPGLRALQLGRPGHHALRAQRRRDRPAGPDDAEHGPAAAHPLPAAGQQGLHAAHGARPRGVHPPGHRRHHRSGHRVGRGRLRHRPVGRAPPPGHCRAAGRPAGGPPQDVRVVQPHGGERGPRVPGPGRGGPDRRHGALRLRRRALRQEAHRPPRGPHERADHGRGGGRAAERHGARALLPPPHRGRQRDHPQPDVGWHARLLRAPRPVGAPAARPHAAPDRRRRDAALSSPR